MDSREVRRIESAAEDFVEGEFKHAPRAVLTEPVVLETHELLDYARMLAEIANHVRGRVQAANAVVVGFPTGSIALGLECLIALDVGPRVHSIRDLKHSPEGESKKDREVDLYQLLDHLFADGAAEFIFLDEVISGSSFAGIVKSVARWAKNNDLAGFPVSLVAASELGLEECEALVTAKTNKGKAGLTLNVKSFSCAKLLAYDKVGDTTLGITKRDDLTGYDWSRTCSTLDSGKPALHIRCPDNGPGTAWPSHSDIASSFASIVRHILNRDTPPSIDSWPETIFRDETCTTCVSLLKAAREKGDQLRSICHGGTDHN